MLEAITLPIVFFLAYANGANDNFKGVATLFGSGLTKYIPALRLATLATLCGSIAAFFLAQTLVTRFSGSELVPEMVLLNPTFPIAVAFASALTVWIATHLGFPVSTTHAIIGGLLGCGLVQSGLGLNFVVLVKKFLIPLILSPILSMSVAFLIYNLVRTLRVRLGVVRESCICVGNQVVQVIPQGAKTVAIGTPLVSLGTEATCITRYQGDLLGISVGPAMDRLHYFSAAMVSLARGLNDTPKIAAILWVSSHWTTLPCLCVVALFMALGGVLSARKVAQTLSQKITPMNPGQGLVANGVTSAIVVLASLLGLPVSTTHVCCGTLFGIGWVNGEGHWKMIRAIVMAWLSTLPVAAAIGAMVMGLLRLVGIP